MLKLLFQQIIFKESWESKISDMEKIYVYISEDHGDLSPLFKEIYFEALRRKWRGRWKTKGSKKDKDGLGAPPVSHSEYMASNTT